MKNHHKHPTGVAPLPEVHSVQGKGKKNKRKFKGSNFGDLKNKPEKKTFNKKHKPNQRVSEVVMLRPKMTLNVIDVALLITLLKIAILQCILPLLRTSP
jgi:hypothetical protein